MQWLVVRPADNVVVGWGSAPGAVPASTAEQACFECTDEEHATWNSLQAQAIADGREPSVLRDPATGALSLPPDARPVFRFEADNLSPLVGQAFNATVTFVSNPAFSGTLDVTIASGRTFRLTFVDGVATRTWSFPESGIQELRSTPTFKLESPVTFHVAE